MKNIIVTGGAGFIGSNLVDKLIELGHKVFIWDNLSSGKIENINPKAEFHNLDITDFDSIKPLFENVDYVFHLAAIPRVLISVENPFETSRINILGTINIFKASIDAKVKRVIFASSSSVYGEQKELALREDMAPNPISPYGLQKLTGEQFAKLFTNLYKMPIICLRFFNVFGPRIDFDSDYSLVIGKFLRLRKEKKPLTIFGSGEQTRGFSYIDDVVEANIKAMRSERLKGGEVINIGSEKSHSVNYLAKIIGGQVKYLPPRQGDPLHTQADLSLSKELLNWVPKISFEKGLEKTKKWFNKNFKN